MSYCVFLFLFCFSSQTQSDHDTFSPGRLWTQSASRRVCPRPQTSTWRTGSGYSGEQWADGLISQQCSSSPRKAQLTLYSYRKKYILVFPVFQRRKPLNNDVFWGVKVKIAKRVRVRICYFPDFMCPTAYVHVHVCRTCTILISCTNPP